MINFINSILFFIFIAQKNEQKRSESHSTNVNNVQTSPETSLLLNNDPKESISIDNQSDDNRLGCNDTVVETIENDDNNDQTEKESKSNLNKKVKEKCNKNVSTINQKIQSENFKQQVAVKKEIIDINDTTVADRSSSSSSDEQSALTIDDNPRRNSSNETLAVNNNNITTTTPDDINTVLNDIIMLEEEAQNHQQQKQLEQPKIKQEITETVKNEIEDDDDNNKQEEKEDEDLDLD